jgi:DNA-binding CsgD family transcriptional regulator
MDPPPARALVQSGEGFMHIERVSEFISFLSLRQHKLEDVLSHLVHRVLVDIQATSIFVSSLSHENNVEYVAQFGLDPHIWELYPKTTQIFKKYPITDAMRTRKTTWINTLPDWGDEYPLLKPIEYPGKEKTFIGMAIEKCGTPVAVVGIFAAPVIEVDGETDAFLGTIANILSLYLYVENDGPEASGIRLGNSAAIKKVKTDEKLTDRQMLILKMISENRTNILISEILGYSESTIRQETIKIYAKLGCNGREEASRIYKESLKQEDLVS